MSNLHDPPLSLNFAGKMRNGKLQRIKLKVYEIPGNLIAIRVSQIVHKPIFWKAFNFWKNTH